MHLQRPYRVTLLKRCWGLDMEHRVYRTMHHLGTHHQSLGNAYSMPLLMAQVYRICTQISQKKLLKWSLPPGDAKQNKNKSPMAGSNYRPFPYKGNALLLLFFFRSFFKIPSVCLTFKYVIVSSRTPISFAVTIYLSTKTIILPLLFKERIFF